MVLNKDIEEYIKWEKQNNSPWANFKKTLKPIHVIFLFALSIMGYSLISSGTTNKTLIIIAIAGILFLIFLKSDKIEKKPLPEPIIKFIGYHALKKKIETDFPNGTRIVSLPYGKLRWQGDWGKPFQPWKWEKGFKIIYPNKREIEVLTIHNPYDGYITGIALKPAGYNGEDSTDLKIMPVQIVEFKGEDKSS